MILKFADNVTSPVTETSSEVTMDKPSLSKVC